MTSLAEKIAPYAAQFRRDGFVMVPDLLSLEEIDRYGAAVDEAVARRKRFDHRELRQKSLYEQSFIQCINLWEDSPAVRPLTFHPVVCEAAARLLGVDAIRLWHDQALYKEAGGRKTDPHQDQPYWPMRETDTITAWIPFDGSSHATGCMGYIPGSHLAGLKKFVNIFQPEEALDILALPQFKDTPPEWIEAPRGGVAFHHGLTVHLAKPNRGSHTRRVHTMIFFRDGTTRGNQFPHFAVDRFGIKIGDAIDSPVTPIAWPRAAGDLPDPPTVPIGDLHANIQKIGMFPDAPRKN
ncbi:MAG: phytanoyl-CoA dioxygenase family protein [Candidatus Binatus sp.]|uniref:phytanoyl-CoA dioxygenase family protein n=1 Tax=Candidatus Binatus sp. TaxID=2811406 RepID=UPI002723D94E|nr:phytanoyl-CoA dioxygenase family protein [Candidatus Binatus sp.]MDO8433233.1 phytanoyl-CoA dioxygenase family protein [Candidatus Binatus sp.]